MLMTMKLDVDDGVWLRMVTMEDGNCVGAAVVKEMMMMEAIDEGRCKC